MTDEMAALIADHESLGRIADRLTAIEAAEKAVLASAREWFTSPDRKPALVDAVRTWIDLVDGK